MELWPLEASLESDQGALVWKNLIDKRTIPENVSNRDV